CTTPQEPGHRSVSTERACRLLPSAGRSQQPGTPSVLPSAGSLMMRGVPDAAEPGGQPGKVPWPAPRPTVDDLDGVPGVDGRPADPATPGGEVEDSRPVAG